MWLWQVTKVFPELACRMVQLHQNRRTWQDRYLSSLEADPSLASAEKGAEKVCTPGAWGAFPPHKPTCTAVCMRVCTTAVVTKLPCPGLPATCFHGRVVTAHLPSGMQCWPIISQGRPQLEHAAWHSKLMCNATAARNCSM